MKKTRKKRIVKNQQRKEDLFMQINDQPLLDDLSDNDELNGKLKYKITYYYLVNFEMLYIFIVNRTIYKFI